MKIWWLFFALYPCSVFAQSSSVDFVKYAESLRNHAISTRRPDTQQPTGVASSDSRGPQVTVQGVSQRPAKLPPKSFEEFFDGNKLRTDLFKVYPDWEETIRKLDAKLESSAVLLQATVLNISNNGALVAANIWKDAKPSQSPDMVATQPIFVYGVPDWLIDGAVWKGYVYPVGRYQYIATDGSTRTVIAMAVTKQMSLKLMSAKK